MTMFLISLVLVLYIIKQYRTIQNLAKQRDYWKSEYHFRNREFSDFKWKVSCAKKKEDSK